MHFFSWTFLYILLLRPCTTDRPFSSERILSYKSITLHPSPPSVYKGHYSFYTERLFYTIRGGTLAVTRATFAAFYPCLGRVSPSPNQAQYESPGLKLSTLWLHTQVVKKHLSILTNPLTAVISSYGGYLTVHHKGAGSLARSVLWFFDPHQVSTALW